MSIYYTTEGQSLYDVGVQIYGSADSFADLVLANPLVDLNATLSTGTAINYDATKTYLKEVVTVVPIIATRPTYSVWGNQSLYDLSIQLYGDLSGLVNLIGVFTDINATQAEGTLINPVNTDNFAANTYFQNYTVQTLSQIGNGLVYLATDAGVELTTDTGTVLTPG